MDCNEEKTEELDEETEKGLEKLINQHEIMLFMKGDRAYPECGFSSEMVQILDKNKVDYKTFDILEDENVRNNLKIYSNWYTYPQLYVKGELIGGLDVVKQLVAAGTLMKFLKADDLFEL